MERNIYLKNTDIEEAVSLYLEKLEPLLESVKTEFVDIRQGNGRVTAAPVFAKVSSPNHNAAAMDGIMVIAERTFEANEANPILLVRGSDFEYINTGHMIKEPYDSVIMIEDVIMMDQKESETVECRGCKEMMGIETDTVKIMTQASPWQHIRPIGEDIVLGEMIIPENHTIRPMDMGAILAGAVTQVEVFEKISLGIMPTGTEITDSYDKLEKGKLFDTNSWTFKAVAEDMGCVVERISPVNDEYDVLKETILSLVEKNHVVVINAGSSAGSKDFTSTLISELGELVLHGIAIKPGKPTILGIIKGKPVIGVPGYPASAFLVFEEVVGPVIRALQRKNLQQHQFAEAVLSRRIVSSLKYREYIRVKLGKVGGKLVATPLNRGAGVTTALVKADGLLVVPKNSEGFEAGETAQVELLKSINVIENTIVSIGSHDLIMDLIGNILEKQGRGDRRVDKPHLSSAHVGSMGGIMALMRGEAHIAPIHLLDENSGEYNVSYLGKYLGEEATLIKGVHRVQGLMVAKGNLKNIKGITDLARKGVSFVNRQRGSGTRILTDYLLKQEGVEASAIFGYDREMTTHMAVAAAVESGTADVGIGVYSAAKAMGLEFVPIGNEEYDFAVAKKYLKTPMIQAFIEVLQGDEFKAILKELGGYGV
jgi:putative molybdopterin biosynthesis protein